MRHHLLFLAPLLAACAACSAATTERTDQAALAATRDLPRSGSVLSRAHLVVEQARSAGERVDVLAYRELDGADPGQVLLQAEDPARTGFWTERETVLACYEVTLDARDGVSAPRATECPDPAAPLVLPPDPGRALPSDVPGRLVRVLETVGAQPAVLDVERAVRRVSPLDRLEVTAEVQQGDVAVAVVPGGRQPCLFVTRRAGVVRSRQVAGPVETCRAEAALHA